MNWTLIFCADGADSPQVFHVEGDDPAEQARRLKRGPDMEWLGDYALLAAVPGHHAVATRDDSHSFDECTLHMNGAARGMEGVDHG